MEELITSFVLLWSVIDPVGTIPVFIAVSRNRPEKERRKIAVHAVLIAGGILLFFLVMGQVLLDAMGIPLDAFQVSGGIVLFLFALTMIFGETKPEEEMKSDRGGLDAAVFPLAVPSIASPGAMMAIVLLTDNNRFSWQEQAVTGAMMLFVLACTLGLLLCAPAIHRRIGNVGAGIISRVMGLILGAIAVSAVMEGIRDYYGI